MICEVSAARWLGLCLVIAFCSGLSSAAVAQDGLAGPDPVAAELFRQGRDLIKQAKWQEGCDKLAASMRRYAAASTLMNLARCDEHEGRIASAWVKYQRALVLNRETDGAKRRERLNAVGREAIAQLEPRLPRLRVTVEPKVPGARVSEAGRELPLDTAVPLDPGAHELLASAPGRLDVKRQIELREAETLAVTIAFADRAHEPSGPVEPPPASTKPTPHDAPPPATPSTEGPAVPAWVWVSGIGGVVCGAVSAAFAVDAVNAAEDLESRCGSDLVCDEDLTFDPEPLNARKNRGTALAIGFGVGALGGLVAASVGLLTMGTRSSTPTAVTSATVTPWVGSQTAGLVASGRF